MFFLLYRQVMTAWKISGTLPNIVGKYKKIAENYRGRPEDILIMQQRQFHEGFVVLGQFCDKALIINKMLLQNYDECIK